MRKNILILFSFVFALLLFISYRETAYKPCLIIKNGSIFNGLTDSYQSLNIRIEKGVIHSIVSRDHNDKKCKKIDVTGSSILPGLIDSHTHLLLGGLKSSVSVENIIRHALGLSDRGRLEMGRENALSMLQNGFTTVRDLGNSGDFLDLELKIELDLNPKKGPHIIISGPGLAVHPTQAGAITKEYRSVQSSEDIQRYLKENVDRKISWIKVYADNDPQPGLMNEDLLSEVVKRAHELNLKVALHTTERIGTELGLKLKADSLEHFYSTPQENISSSISAFVVLTDLSRVQCEYYGKNSKDTFYQNCLKLTELRASRIKWAQKHGLTLVFGSDVYVDGAQTRGQNAIESLLALAEEGLTPLQVLQAAGIHAGKMLGDKCLGTIQPGCSADLVIVRGNPLEDLQSLKNIQLVIKSGHRIEAP